METSDPGSRTLPAGRWTTTAEGAGGDEETATATSIMVEGRDDDEDGDSSNSNNNIAITSPPLPDADDAADPPKKIFIREKIDDDDDDSSHIIDIPFPKLFYCPLTRQILKDPVVHPNGRTYEKRNIIKQFQRRQRQQQQKRNKNKKSRKIPKLYPNRALKNIIDRQVKEYMRRRGNGGGDITTSRSSALSSSSSLSIRETVRNVNDSLREGWNRLLFQSALPFGTEPPSSSDDDKQLDINFYCPITQSLFHHPVIDPDGQSYEKEAIVTWITNNGDSPITRNQLRIDDLYDNLALLNLLQLKIEEATQEVDGDDTKLRPSIRQWKEEEIEEEKDEEGGTLVPTSQAQQEPISAGPSSQPTTATSETVVVAPQPNINHTNTNNAQSNANNNNNNNNDQLYSYYTRQANTRAGAAARSRQQRRREYPTTRQELDARNRRQQNCKVYGIMLAIIIVVCAPLFIFVSPLIVVGVMLAMLLMAWCAPSTSSSSTTTNRQQDRPLPRHLRTM